MANKSLKNHWKKQIQSWQKSGMSQKEFCSKAGISAHQFGYWRTKLLKEATSNQENTFLPIKTSNEFSIFLGELKISFEHQPCPSWMASFVKNFQEAHAQS